MLLHAPLAALGALDFSRTVSPTLARRVWRKSLNLFSSSGTFREHIGNAKSMLSRSVLSCPTSVELSQISTNVQNQCFQTRGGTFLELSRAFLWYREFSKKLATLERYAFFEKD